MRLRASFLVCDRQTNNLSSMVFRINMRSLKHFTSVKRQMFLTGLLSLTTLALAANLLTRRHPGTGTTSSSDVERYLPIQKSIMDHVKQKHNRSPATHKTVSLNPVWSHNAPENEFRDRANELVQSNLLKLEAGDEWDGGDGNALLPSKSNRNDEFDQFSNKDKDDDQSLNPTQYGTRLSEAVKPEDAFPKVLPGQNLEKLLQPLSDRGKWRTWPECLCGAQEGVECTRLTEPAEGPKMAHGSGGACSWRAWRDSDEKVISVSLFGPSTTHDPHLDNLINASREHYPGWSVWVYLKHPIPGKMCSLLQSAPHIFFCDTRVIPSLGDLKRSSPLVWRVSPLGDPRVKMLFVKNLNNSPLEREAAAVKEWALSNKTWHVMRDHPAQSNPVPGGQWGAQWEVGTETNMAALRHILLTRVVPSFTPGLVNKFLSGALWSKILRDSLMLHDSYHCQSAPDGSFRPWPTRRSGGNYVGMSDKAETLPDCPVECRPPSHRDWFTC